ncbi:hypothetical protein B0T25DRAFT_550974 [Lasiosphaeria hispida]|uniref:Uncharacterized protein n=1 Tax=Lasiosphaeria hispida TaxID=260671 RepID=A0AAJ0HAL2_9PEZI|nr:hypothetical protein B0T25DRAFT_550974 [Lasiosphaeria hispida]
MSSILSDDSLASGRSSQIARDHARPPREGEPTHKGKNLMFYCKYCPDFGAQNTSTFKNHLQSKHQIITKTS